MNFEVFTTFNKSLGQTAPSVGLSAVSILPLLVYKGCLLLQEGVCGPGCFEAL